MDHDWEIYRRRRRPGPATVRIWRDGRRALLAFTTAAWERLGRPAAVVFLTDRAEHLIGFRPASRGEPNAYAVTGPGHVVSVTLLLRFMGEPPPGRYPLRDGGGLPPHIAVTPEHIAGPAGGP